MHGPQVNNWNKYSSVFIPPPFTINSLFQLTFFWVMIYNTSLSNVQYDPNVAPPPINMLLYMHQETDKGYTYTKMVSTYVWVFKLSDSLSILLSSSSDLNIPQWICFTFAIRNKLLSLSKKSSEHSCMGFSVPESERWEGFSFFIEVEMITGVGERWSLNTNCVHCCTAWGNQGPYHWPRHRASVCTGACDGQTLCSWNKGPVSTTIQHKGQRSPVYFGFETFKWGRAETFEFSLFSVSYKKTNCSESGIFWHLPWIKIKQTRLLRES